MIIVLIGYMASGKSSIGKVLAKNLDYSFIDLDDYIEKKEKKSIKDIFKTKGEIYFRKKEAQYLNEISSSMNNLILSLGGGTPCYGNNMQRLQKDNTITTIYLKANLSTLIKRLENEKQKRPLIAHLESNEALTEFIGKHLFERIPFYSLSDFTISTDNKTEREIVETIISSL